MHLSRDIEIFSHPLNDSHRDLPGAGLKGLFAYQISRKGSHP